MNNLSKTIALSAVIAAMGIAGPALADTAQSSQAHANAGFHLGFFLGKGPMHQAGVVGTVASVSGNTLTVTAKQFTRDHTENDSNKNDSDSDDASANVSANIATVTYTVDATNAKVTKNGTDSSLSAVAVGDMVMIQGTVSGSNVTATAIVDGKPQMGKPEPKPMPNPIIQGNGQPVVAGSVTGISGSTLTITNKSNVTYTVDASSATVAKGNATSTLSSVAVGDTVVVQGAVNGSSITASSIIDTKASANADSGKKHGFGGFFLGIGGFFAHLFGF